MDLFAVFRHECTSVHSNAPDKESLLREIATLAKKCNVLDEVSEDTIFTHLKQREELGSTGFQNGIAIPHCLLAGVPEFVVGLITHKSGVDFEAFDGKPTRIIPFIVGPKQERNTHIRLLSAISRILTAKTIPDELLAATDTSTLAESFLRNVGGALTQDGTAKRHLITVSIQDESIFEEILQLFSEQDGCHVSVIEAHNTSEYLRGLPLFAAFWSEDGKGFHRMLFVSVKHTFANELLRRLDTLVGGLDSRKGIFVQVIEPLFTAGQLDI